jgi:hypothetical protein
VRTDGDPAGSGRHPAGPTPFAPLTELRWYATGLDSETTLLQLVGNLLLLAPLAVPAALRWPRLGAPPTPAGVRAWPGSIGRQVGDRPRHRRQRHHQTLLGGEGRGVLGQRGTRRGGQAAMPAAAASSPAPVHMSSKTQSGTAACFKNDRL